MDCLFDETSKDYFVELSGDVSCIKIEGGGVEFRRFDV